MKNVLTNWFTRWPRVIEPVNKTQSPSWVLPWNQIPDVKSVKVRVKGFSALFAMFGISKRQGTELIFEKYNNGSINRYITHQSIRLNKAVDAQKWPLFWVIARQILNRSHCFLVAGLHHCEPHWHREMPLKDLYTLLRTIKRIRLGEISCLRYSRIYIPKNETEDRPLGVPTLAWRIHLHTFANILSILLKATVPKTQHGFFPGRGTLTAWQDLISRLQEKDIYEFDLSKFFDKVKVGPTLYKLDQMFHLPQDIFDSLVLWSISEVRFPFGAKLPDLEKGFGPHGTINPPQFSLSVNMREGFPQGSPISPILTSFALSQSLQQDNPKILMYADDGLSFGPMIWDTPLQRRFGITPNLSKSGWVKRDGQWITPLKFLGIIYNWKEDTLETKTRKFVGSFNLGEESKMILNLSTGYNFVETLREWFTYFLPQLRATEKDRLPDYRKLELMLESTEDNRSHYRNRKTWQQFMTSKFSGYLQSRLYGGSWDDKKGIENWNQQFSHNSFGRNRFPKGTGITVNIYNSSSIACRSIANMLRYQYHHEIRKPQ